MAIEAQIWLSIEHESGELNRAKLQNPETLPYLEEGADERVLKKKTNEKLAATIQLILEMHLDFFDSLGSDHLKSVKDLELGGRDRVAWEAWIADSFKNSPALCRRYKVLKDYYTSYLREFAHQNCAN